MKYEDLNDYQKDIAKSIGYMGIVHHDEDPNVAFENSLKILDREGVPRAVSTQAIYSFTNSLIIKIASQFEEKEDESRDKEG